MAYAAWSVSYGEQPSASKWNILGTNDASFNDGTGIASAAITPEKLVASTGTTWAWTSYAPTWSGSGSNPAIGNGTLQGYYQQTGKNMKVRIVVKMGSTTTYGSGVWKWSVPTSAISTASSVFVGKAHILDSGTSYYSGVSHIGAGTAISSNTTVDAIRIVTHGGTNDAGATHPITFANGDGIVIFIEYEVA